MTKVRPLILPNRSRQSANVTRLNLELRSDGGLSPGLNQIVFEPSWTHEGAMLLTGMIEALPISVIVVTQLQDPGTTSLTSEEARHSDLAI